MDPEIPNLPFLTRDMLKFGHKIPLRLRLSAASDIVGEIKLKGFTRHGIIDLPVITTADGVVNADTVGIDDIPIMISAVDEGDTFAPNQCWCNISLELAEEEAISIASGFVYLDKGIGWPYMNHSDAVPNRGFMAEVSSSDPGNQTEALITVPDGELWLLHSASIELDTDANGGNRQTHLVITNPGGNEINFWNGSAIGANEVVVMSFAQFGVITEERDDNDERVAMPPNMWILPGGTIGTQTSLFKTGDNYAPLNVLVEKFMAQS